MKGLKEILKGMKKEGLTLEGLEMKKIYKLCSKRGYEGSEENFSKDFMNILMEGLKNLKVSNEDLLKVAGGSNIMNNKKFTAAALSILGLASSFSPTAGASFLTDDKKSVGEVAKKSVSWVKQNPKAVGAAAAAVAATGGAVSLAAIVGVGAHVLKKVNLEDASAKILGDNIEELRNEFKTFGGSVSDANGLLSSAEGVLKLDGIFDEPPAVVETASDEEKADFKIKKEAYDAFMKLGGKDLKNKLEKIVNAANGYNPDGDALKKDKLAVLRAWNKLLGNVFAVSKKGHYNSFIKLSLVSAIATQEALNNLAVLVGGDDSLTSSEQELKGIIDSLVGTCNKLQGFADEVYVACHENEATIKSNNGFGLYELHEKLFTCKTQDDFTALQSEIDKKQAEFKNTKESQALADFHTVELARVAAIQEKKDAETRATTLEGERDALLARPTQEALDTAVDRATTAEQRIRILGALSELRDIGIILNGIAIRQNVLGENRNNLADRINGLKSMILAAQVSLTQLIKDDLTQTAQVAITEPTQIRNCVTNLAIEDPQHQEIAIMAQPLNAVLMILQDADADIAEDNPVRVQAQQIAHNMAQLRAAIQQQEDYEGDLTVLIVNSINSCNNFLAKAICESLNANRNNIMLGHNDVRDYLIRCRDANFAGKSQEMQDLMQLALGQPQQDA